MCNVRSAEGGPCQGVRADGVQADRHVHVRPLTDHAHLRGPQAERRPTPTDLPPHLPTERNPLQLHQQHRVRTPSTFD